MEFKLNRGFFRRKVKFRFDLAALKAATVAARLDLGEFYTSDKLTDDDRLFFHAYGAWLYNRPVNLINLDKFSKLWGKLNIKQMNQIKSFRAQSEIVSEHYMKALKQAATEEKKKP
ncbi:MAG: hypothetical protein EA392_01530 [Cryomorphaceae bacterium]|nr:MAG: hypothetical protein EA392_01530 [Cryomorphaceae bacterium]